MKSKDTHKNIHRVLIVDDHQIMRQGLAALVDQEDDLTVCDQAEDIHGALDAIERSRPDIAIIDLSLKECSGLDLIKDVQIRWPDLKIMVLSMHDESFYAERVLRAGAKGYVTKAEVATKVIDGLRAVLAGDIYISQKISEKMLRKMVGGKNKVDMFPLDRLSDREFEVFELIGQGLQSKEVAERLHLSSKTIDAHRDHIKKKLDLDSATGLLTYAVQWVQFERNP